MVNFNKNKFFNHHRSQFTQHRIIDFFFLRSRICFFFGISNISFVGKLRARMVIVGTELCSHFLFAHAFGLIFLRILILGF